MDDTAASRGLGGRIAAGIASHLVSATLSARQGSAPLQRQVGATILDDFFRLTGSELQITMGDTFRMLADHPATDPAARPLFDFLARGNGQMATFIGGSITGSVISGGIGDLITNALAPVVHAIIGNQPHNILAPSDVAAAQARGIGIGQDHAREATQSGLNGDRYNALLELNYRRPDLDIVLDLLNRGHISEGGARGALVQLGFRSGDVDDILSTRRVLLTPAALADMVVRGIMAEADAAAVANQSGLSTQDFHALVLDTGEAPAIEQLLFLHRRGFIDTDRLTHGIHQSRVRDEWIDAILKLSLQPMSTADAVEAAVQGHLSEDASRAIAQQNGLEPEHWQVLYDTAGNPPGVQEMISMWRRGKLTRAELEQGIKESRLKNKYIGPIIAASETLPPERSIVSLVTKGALGEARAMDLLLQRGYAQDIATALLSEAHTTKTAKQRDVTEAQWVALYEDRAIDRNQAASMLSTLGYDDTEAGWILDLADLRHLKKFNDAAIAHTHSLYVGYKIDDTTATTTLDQLGIAPDQRNDLLALWGIERTVNTKQLTLAQIEAAYKHKVIDGAEMYARLQGIGYAADDALIIVKTLGFDPNAAG